MLYNSKAYWISICLYHVQSERVGEWAGFIERAAPGAA